MLFNWIYKHYQERFYDKLVEQFIGEVPDAVRAPVIDWLADRKVLFEKFLSIQAYHIQKARIQSKKSQEFYDGALVIIKAFLVAVNQKVIQRTTVIPQPDSEKQLKKELDAVSSFMKEAIGKEDK